MKNRAIIDISLPLTSDMPIWPGDKKLSLFQTKSLEKGDSCNVSDLQCGVHVGTHIDAPRHFLDNGKNIDEIDLDVLVGSTIVGYLPKVDIIERSDLENLDLPDNIERLLLRTKNSELWKNNVKEFKKDFVALAPDAAQWIVDRGIKLVGIDYLSIAPYEEGLDTHRILLEVDIVILEGLNLADVSPGNYKLTCLPLFLVGSEGSPARAILQKINSVK